MVLFLLIGQSASAQFDSLFQSMVSDWDSAGFIYFYPQTVQPGDLFSIYQQYFFEDTLNSMQLTKQWEDSLLHMQHYRYQQYYKNIEVEAAEFTEHAGRDGYLVFANGKVCEDVNKEAVPLIAEATALSRLLDSMYNYTFAWMDTSWENELKADLNDSTATYYPSGQLIWALDNYKDLGYLIPRSRYRLAWKFEVFCLKPFFLKDFFVDAATGHIFREDELMETDGPANILTQGTKTIDTRWKGGLFPGHILWTNDNTRNIHTKFYVSLPWGLSSDIRDKDDNWGNYAQYGTTPLWMASQAWDYYNSQPYNRKGFDGYGKEIRVFADYSGENAFYDTIGNNDYLFFGYLDNQYTAVIDVVGHEYMHGINHYSAKLKYKNEPGALDESFADISGFLVERFSEPGGTIDWIIGEDGNFSIKNTRSLEDPKHWGKHYELNGSIHISVIGQLNTYKGTFWQFDSYDHGGVHVNSGVQNYWFYLLAQGGSGINDNGDSYNIQGIGIDKAALIAYWNLTNNLHSSSQYADARAGAIAAARMIYGNCSNEEIQTTNAWAAVGVGDISNCTGTRIKDYPIVETPVLYPNPATDEVLITFPSTKERSLQLFSITGTLIKDIGISNTERILICISDLPKGIYLLRIEQSFHHSFIKLVKQ